MNKGKLAAGRLPGEGADHLLTLHSVDRYLLLLNVEYLKVEVHSL